MDKILPLPKPSFSSDVSFEEAAYRRQSKRSFKDIPLKLNEVSQLLWSAYGKNAYGKKTVPSAGATYPFDIYLVAGNVEGIENGIYLYDGESHSLSLIKNGDFRKSIAEASYGQKFIAQAPVTIILVARFERTTSFYGKRGIRYVYLDAGHIGQNVSLQVETTGLGTCMVGAFDDNKLAEILGVEGDVVYLMPVGKP